MNGNFTVALFVAVHILFMMLQFFLPAECGVIENEYSHLQ